MNLVTALDLREREIISLVGGGGKTTLMFRLAVEIPPPYKTLITTTTKIRIPLAEQHQTLLSGDYGFKQEQAEKFLEYGNRPVLGSRRLPENKLQGVTGEQFNEIAGWSGIDYILVEADGSKGRSLKGHLAYEPVIPQQTTLVVIVIGADILGKYLNAQYVHRPEVVVRLTGSNPEAVIDPKMIARLITHPQGIMRFSPASARHIVIINKVDCLPVLDQAYQTARLLLDEKIKKVVLCSAINELPVFDIITS